MIVTLSEILRDANERHYAVGAFNCLSLENVMGALEAAEELRSPIILQLAEVQFPEVEAYIDRFLLGKENQNTKVRIAPESYKDINLNYWIPWK